ncbi:MAG: iron chelate uptake ABC transporter family permease subunit [Phycisphaerales bacterium]
MTALLAQSITDVSIEWPSLGEIARALTFRAGHNTTVVIFSALLLGVASGMIGSFALLRKRAMMSDALAHCTLPGIALAFLAFTWLGREGRSLPVLLGGAAITGILGVLAVQAIIRHSRLREDAAIGAVLSVFFGAGVVLLSYIQGLSVGNQGGLQHFILGQTAAMQTHDAQLIGACAVGVLVILLLLFKEFRVVCFDDRFARVAGVPVGLMDLAMMALVVVVTVIGLQAVGLVLIVALLIIPAAAARFWTERLTVMVWLAGVLGGLAGYLGAAASSLLPRLPAGAVIVLTAGAIFLFSLLFAPRRGVLAAGARLARLRLHVATDHLLRTMYEEAERAGADPTAARIPGRALARAHGWSPLAAGALTRLLHLRGLVRAASGAVSLTPRGLREAARLTRNHRLWEEYLVTHAEFAASHVDHTADLVEHILAGDLVQRLEAALRARGQLPPAAPPPSIHPIAPAGGAA